MKQDIEKQTNIIKEKREKKAVWLLWGAISVYVALFSFVSFLKFKFFGYDDYDLAYFNQIVWNIVHGSFYSSILGINFLGVHVQLIWFLIAPFYLLFPHPLALLFLQSLAIGAAAYPLYLLAKEVLGYRWGLLVSLMYLIYPAIGYLNLFELHSTAFVPFFMITAFYFFYKEKFNPFIVFLLFAIFCQENISLAAFGIGFYAMCRKRSLRWIVAPCVLAGLYLFLCFSIIIPHFNQNTTQFGLIYSHFGKTFHQIFFNIISDPFATLGIMFRDHNLNFLLQMFGPLSFVSLLSPLWIVAALPLFAQHLLSARLSQTMIQYHYTAEIIPFIFIAFIFGIKNLLRIRILHQYRRIFGLMFFIISLLYVRDLGPHFKIHQLIQIYQKSDDTRQKEEFLKEIPPDSSVVATFRFLPRLTHRSELYSFHHQYMGRYSMSLRPYSLPETVEYALLDFNDRKTFNSFYSLEGYKNTQKFLNQKTWGVIKAEDSTILFKKGAKNKYSLYKILSLKPNPSYKTAFRISEDILFLGYDIKQEEEGILHLTFYWESSKRTKKDFGVLIQAFDLKEKKVLYKEHPICYRIYPTNAWIPGQKIKEELYLTIPSLLEPGKYNLEISIVEYPLRKRCLLKGQNALRSISLGEIKLKKK